MIQQTTDQPLDHKQRNQIRRLFGMPQPRVVRGKDSYFGRPGHGVVSWHGAHVYETIALGMPDNKKLRETSHGQTQRENFLHEEDGKWEHPHLHCSHFSLTFLPTPHPFGSSVPSSLPSISHSDFIAWRGIVSPDIAWLFPSFFHDRTTCKP